jgi:hypothetical protein
VAFVFFTISRDRKTVNNLIPILFAFIAWTGTFFYIRSRIGQAIEDVQMQELNRQ